MDLEDSVASLPPPVEAGEEVAKPRKLGRLRKAGTVENAPPNRAAAPASPGQLGGKPAQGAVDGDQEAPGSPAAPEEEAAAVGDSAAAASPSRLEAAGGGDDESGQQQEGEEEEEVEEDDKERSYYDEEDELEQHFVRRATQGAAGAAASAEASEDEDEGPAGSELSGGSARSGSPGTMELLAADTQRILRETAARDRLGKGHKIEIKPLSSILGRIKERQALAIARAPKPSLPNVGSFDEILAEARQQAGGAAASAAAAGAADPGAEAAAEGEQPGGAAAAAGEGDAAATDAAALAAAGTAEAAAGGDGASGEAREGEEGDDLLIMDSDEEGGAEVRLVELPSTGKKKPRMPFFSQENSYEDEVLIDDGYNSEEEDLGEEEEQEGSELAAEDSSEAEEEEEEEEAGGSDKAASAGGDSPAGAGEALAGSQEERERRQGSVEPSAAESEQQVKAMEHADAEPSGASGEAAVAALAEPAVPKRVKKLQRMFLDMEAELSDEEEGAGHSEDESEDLDDQGELAGLIGAAKETAKDGRLRQQLHRQWAEQQDDKELQQLMAGLKNGFRRRRGGFFDDEDDELAGRRRRARTDGDEDEGAADGGLPWPSPFDAPAGSDDEAEDEELLRKAKEGLLLAASGKGLEDGAGSGGGSAGSLSAGGSGSGAIPLDEGSQEVLGLLLARSALEPQHGSGGAGGGGRSRFAPAGAAAALLPTFGSDTSNSRLAALPGVGSQSRGPSFVGRQPSVVRGASSSNLGAGGRSFVFARDDSQSALPADKGGSGEGGAPAAADSGSQGPTSFANLRQMAGMPGTSAEAGQQQQRKRAGSSLVSRLKPPAHRAGKEPVGSQPADPAASAAAAAAAVAVMAGGGRRAK